MDTSTYYSRIISPDCRSGGMLVRRWRLLVPRVRSGNSNRVLEVLVPIPYAAGFATGWLCEAITIKAESQSPSQKRCWKLSKKTQQDRFPKLRKLPANISGACSTWINDLVEFVCRVPLLTCLVVPCGLSKRTGAGLVVRGRRFAMLNHHQIAYIAVRHVLRVDHLEALVRNHTADFGGVQ